MPRMVRILCTALLTIVGLVGSSVPVRAEDRDACERQIHQAEDKLRDAIQRHGEDSKQARKRRDQLEDVKHRCGDPHDKDHHDDHDQH